VKHLEQKYPHFAESSQDRSLSVDQAPQVIGKLSINQLTGAEDESKWAFPTQQSPEASSGSNSVAGQSSLSMAGGVDDLMADIDWVRFHKIHGGYSTKDYLLGRI
jgi:hypothetical protein